MPGPLPQEHRRRRNAPTIPTTNLPVDGRKGRPPNPPGWIELGEHGRAFWVWAWGTPQAAAWSKGHHVALAHRASLEDDLAALDDFETGIDLVELLALDEEDPPAIARAISARLNYMVGKLKALAGGKVAIIAKIQKSDESFGLDPLAMAKLRWKIVAPDDPAAAPRVELGEDDDDTAGVAYLDRFRKQA